MTSVEIGLIVASAVLLVGAVCLLDLLATPFQRVSRARVEKFARRQSLFISVGNGPLIIRYLATTRRWRGGCLLITALASVLVPLAAQMFWPLHPLWQPRLSSVTLFAGWFVGAVIAEWRVSAAAAAGRRRAAVLEPRLLADYVRRPSRVVPTVACGALAAFEVFALGFVLARHRNGLVPVSGWVALTAVAGTLLALVGRRVLLRPQRQAGADLIAADDAIRSRSLHVLAGCALAIAGYLGTGLAQTMTAYSSVLQDGVAGVIGAVGGLFLPILGFIVATSTMPPIRRAVPVLAERAA